MPASQNDIGVLSNFVTSRGYQKFNLDGSVKQLSPPDIKAKMFAVINSLGGITRYRDDGVDPTGETGQPIVNKLTINYIAADLDAFRFIEDSTEPATEVNVTYYSYNTASEIKDSKICLPQSYLEFSLAGTQVAIQDNNILSFEDTIGSGTQNVSGFGCESGYLDPTGLYHNEATLKTQVGTGLEQGIILSNVPPADFNFSPTQMVCGIQIDIDGGEINDFQAGTVASGLTITNDLFIYAIDFDSEAGTCFLKYSEDGGATLAGENIAITVSNFDPEIATYTNFFGVTGGTINDATSLLGNSGDSVQLLPTAGSTGYCLK